MNRIIDTDELITDLIRLKNSFGDVFYAKQYAQGIEQAIDAIRARVANSPQADGMVPDVMFDGYTVFNALSEKAKARTSAENVSDVLDAIVKIMRSTAYKPQAEDALQWVKNATDEEVIDALENCESTISYAVNHQADDVRKDA